MTALGRLALCLLLVTAAGPLAAGGDPPPPSAAPKAVYFEVSNGPPSEAFVIALVDPARIAQARAQLAGTAPPRFVSGIVVRAPAAYNPRWSFHLDPATISLVEMAIEVCDAGTSYVEAHLDEVGGAFLPGGRWCPWHSRIMREAPAPPARR
jgi:hypothetical protein